MPVGTGWTLGARDFSHCKLTNGTAGRVGAASVPTQRPFHGTGRAGTVTGGCQAVLLADRGRQETWSSWWREGSFTRLGVVRRGALLPSVISTHSLHRAPCTELWALHSAPPAPGTRAHLGHSARGRGAGPCSPRSAHRGPAAGAQQGQGRLQEEKAAEHDWLVDAWRKVRVTGHNGALET